MEGQTLPGNGLYPTPNPASYPAFRAHPRPQFPSPSGGRHGSAIPPTDTGGRLPKGSSTRNQNFRYTRVFRHVPFTARPARQAYSSTARRFSLTKIATGLCTPAQQRILHQQSSLRRLPCIHWILLTSFQRRKGSITRAMNMMPAAWDSSPVSVARKVLPT